MTLSCPARIVHYHALSHLTMRHHCVPPKTGRAGAMQFEFREKTAADQAEADPPSSVTSTEKSAFSTQWNVGAITSLTLLPSLRQEGWHQLTSAEPSDRPANGFGRIQESRAPSPNSGPSQRGIVQEAPDVRNPVSRAAMRRHDSYCASAGRTQFREQMRVAARCGPYGR